MVCLAKKGSRGWVARAGVGCRAGVVSPGSRLVRGVRPGRVCWGRALLGGFLYAYQLCSGVCTAAAVSATA